MNKLRHVSTTAAAAAAAAALKKMAGQQQQQLAALPEIERLSPAVIRILGGNPGKFTLQGTNTYLVGTGPSRLLIDTGEGKPSWAAAVRRALGGGDQGPAASISISAALLTHWHGDHVGGVAQLLGEVAPGARVYKRRRPAGAAGEAERAYEDIADGQVFEVEGARLRAVFTPGHTDDHMAFVLEGEGGGAGPGAALFTGDNVLGHGTAVFEDLAVYLASLARMEHLVDDDGPAYPGHGPVLPSASKAVAEYIAHRARREQQVLEVLASEKRGGGGGGSGSGYAPWDAMDIVKIIYKDVPENLHAPALGGVLQILRKLKGEGKVAEEEDGRWRLLERPSL